LREQPLISTDQHWALWALLFLTAGFGLWAEKTKWGSKLSAVIVTILTTFLFSNLSIIPTHAPSYNILWAYLVPIAIPLLLFKANMRRIIKGAGPTLIAFTIGAAGTVLAFNLIPLGEEGWKLAGIFCSTYIGGSMNFVASAEALQMNSGEILTAGVAANNLMMTVYFIILFAALILTVHLTFLLLAGKIFKLDLAEIVIASNANMGDPLRLLLWLLQESGRRW